VHGFVHTTENIAAEHAKSGDVPEVENVSALLAISAAQHLTDVVNTHGNARHQLAGGCVDDLPSDRRSNVRKATGADKQQGGGENGENARHGRIVRLGRDRFSGEHFKHASRAEAIGRPDRKS